MTANEILSLARQALADDKRATSGPFRTMTEPRMPSSAWCSVHTGAPDGPGQTVAQWVLEDDASFIAAARTREPQLARWVEALLGQAHSRSWFEAKGGEGSYSGVGVALTLFGKWHSIDVKGARALAAALLRAADEAERGGS